MPRRGRSVFGVKMGARMQAARESLGLTQEDAAKKMGLTVEAYGSYERGWRMPPHRILPRIAGVLQRSLQYLYGLPEPQGLTEDEALLVNIYRGVESQALRQTIRDVAYSQLKVEQTIRGEARMSAGA